MHMRRDTFVHRKTIKVTIVFTLSIRFNVEQSHVKMYHFCSLFESNIYHNPGVYPPPAYKNLYLLSVWHNLCELDMPQAKIIQIEFEKKNYLHKATQKNLFLGMKLKIIFAESNRKSFCMSKKVLTCSFFLSHFCF